MVRRAPAVLTPAARLSVALAGTWLVSSIVLRTLPRTGLWPGTIVVALIALPLATLAAVCFVRAVVGRPRAAASALAAGAGIAAVFGVAHVDLLAGAGKALAGVSLGVLAAPLLERPRNVALVALMVIAVDTYSVAAGPTHAIAADAPGLLHALTIPFAASGRASAVRIGITDFVFLGLLTASALLWTLRPRLTLPLCALSFSATVLCLPLLSRTLPALPLLALAFLAPNAGSLLRGR